ncbi:ABC transporter ATP-binding protein [Variovorax sp. VNK109]|uniref:ABC transporter ATP-binding protein n=1 Tax=Variovorax sp. VNK109 TaxID=3400919 RepID=UPI003C0B754B
MNTPVSPTLPLLQVSSLHLSIAQRHGPATPILRNVNLSVMPGETLGLVGESGGGKTMVGKAVLGILPAMARIDDGAIEFAGHNLLSLSPGMHRRMLGKDIAMILQNPMTALNPVFRIGRQITDIIRYHLGVSSQEAKARALAMLEAVQIREPQRVFDLYPHELSGGMCQRVVISIAFSCEPKLIIADEPTTALDVTVQHQILKLIKSLQQRVGTSVLFVTHDLGVVAKVCDRVSVINAGRILESGTVQEVFSAPRHPYTRALFAAAPRYDQPDAPLQAVPESLRAQLLAEARAYDKERQATRA